MLALPRVIRGYGWHISCPRSRVQRDRSRLIFSEAEMQWLWGRQLFRTRDLRTEDSRTLRVEFPGVPSLYGPDFRSARIWIDGEPRTGDVELHLTSSGWALHQHRSNVEFSNVILHVALRRENDPHGPVSFHGERIPELVLEPYLDRSLVELSSEIRRAVAGAPLARPDAIGRILDLEGDGRLQAKLARMERLLGFLSAEEVLYREFLGALGYSRNRAGFEELAVLLPWSRIRGRSEDEIRDALLWSAGIGDTRPDWLGVQRRLDPALWRRRGVRPSNRPERRIAAAARLLGVVRREGLVEALKLRLLDEFGTNPGRPRRSARRLIRLLSEWGGRDLGEARAAQLLLDVAIPFFIQIFRSASAFEVAGFLRDLWRWAPPPADAFPARFVKEIVFGKETDSQGRSLVNNHRRYQGLLGLYRRLVD